jgi:Protein of unknown function (DUF2786)
VTVDEPLLDKVRKLLAKAEATTNEHEAEAFAAKAASLIASHRIDVARLAARGRGDALAIRSVPIGRGAYVRARMALLDAVASNHDCELVFVSTPGGAVAKLAGFTSDLDATAVLYESLHLQAAARMSRVRRRTPAATQRWRRAYLFGYATRVRELLAATRSQVEADSAGRDGSILPDRPGRAAQVQAFAATAFGRVVAASAPASAVAGGWERGHREASSVDLGRARLAGRGELGPG